MRIAIFSILLLVITQASLASNFKAQPDSIGIDQPAKKVLHLKGKAVLAFLTGLTLGPVGYAAVCIFSHNRIKRKKALLGMEIWTAAALTALIIILILKSGGGSGSGRVSGARSSGSSGSNINISGLGGSGPSSHKRKHMPPVPSPAVTMP